MPLHTYDSVGACTACFLTTWLLCQSRLPFDTDIAAISNQISTAVVTTNHYLGRTWYSSCRLAVAGGRTGPAGAGEATAAADGASDGEEVV